MIKTDKFLRLFIAQEIVALIERIDATDSAGDSSFLAAQHLLRAGQLSFIERKLVSSALSKVARRETLIRAMNVVVFNNIEGEVWHGQLNQTSLQNSLNPYGVLTASADDARRSQ